MKEYQRAKAEVKGSIKILDEEAILDTAAHGLKNLCTMMGMEILRQLLELDATHLAGEKGRHNASRSAYRHGHEQTKVGAGWAQAERAEAPGAKQKR